jgi:hypothetical protein
MSNISLTGSIRTCKVETGWANKIQSDRFLNANNMVCANWNGSDTAGRPSCWAAYNTKSAGCNSALDRVSVENDLRPQYSDYINLDMQGIRGDSGCRGNPANPDSVCGGANIRQSHSYTGQFGYDTGFQQNIIQNCSTCPAYNM